VVTLSKLGIDQFDHDDLRALEVLASHAAVAIENARSLERERDSAASARASEARMTAILGAALDPIIVMDYRGRVTEFNPAAERTFGYPKSQAVGREMAELIVPPRLREAHRAGLARYLATGEARVLGKRVETKAQRADGTEFPVELAITRVDIPGPALFTAQIRDDTARKQAEVEVARALEAEREAAQRLRDLDEMKNTFLKAVSHDLRTPLSAILGIAVTLDRPESGMTPEERADLTRRLVPNARKLYRILSNLLDLERLLSGTVEPMIVRIQVDELVRRVVLEADFLAGREVHVDAQPLLADVDPTAVERIVENLLGNAAKHTDAGTPVWVRVCSQPDGLLLVVEDAGPGVPEEARLDIFEPFRQGPGEHPSPGTGIGLSLVSRFAELQGGRAWVEDRPGGGASFRVLIPTPAAPPTSDAHVPVEANQHR
jgi:PAS domain S-box-containing protein